MNMNTNNPQSAPTGYSYFQKPAASPSSPYKVIDIGTQFCKQYYRMLSVEPEAGYKFYSKMSHLTHGEEGNLEVPMCFGLDEIQQRILSMGFSGCRVFISTIDCQASLQGGVVVVVIGKMQMTGGVLRKFVQSIFLAEQPTGFFVLNDVFRFIEEEEAQSPIQLPHHQQAPASVAPVQPMQPIQPVQPPQPVQPIQPPAPVIEQPVTTAAKSETTWGDSAWVIEQQPTPAVAIPASPAKQQPIKKPDPVAKEEPKAVESPSSWAEITLVHQSKWGNGVVSEAKGTSVAAPAKPANSGATGEARHFKSRHSNKPVAAAAESTSTPSTPTPTPTSNINQRPRRSESFNAEASVFVGNVKSRLEETDIRQAFSTFGAIKTVNIARECLFVEFEAVESAKKAIGTITIGSQDYKVDKRRAPRSAGGSTAGTASTPATPTNTATPTPRPRFQTRTNRTPRPQQQETEEKKGVTVSVITVHIQCQTGMQPNHTRMPPVPNYGNYGQPQPQAGQPQHGQYPPQFPPPHYGHQQPSQLAPQQRPPAPSQAPVLSPVPNQMPHQMPHQMSSPVQMPNNPMAARSPSFPPPPHSYTQPPPYPQSPPIQPQQQYPPQQPPLQQPPAVAPKQAIHPSNIPSPLKIVEEEVNRFRDGPFFMSQLLTRVIPPRSAVDVQIIDDGQSSSRFIRSTCWNLPISEELSEQTRIPLGLSIQPFASLPSHEPPVPVIDFGVNGPIRCNRCRGYINPNVHFVRSGRAWQCNLCGAVTEVRDDYYAALDATGRRVDLHLRPELRSGTIDIVAPAEYNLRPITCAARLLFLVDSSRSAIQSGSFKAALESIRHCLKCADLPQCYSHVAVATFDRSIHFYNLNNKEPQAVVMTDLADPFLPLGPMALFVGTKKTDSVDTFVNKLLELFADSRVVESCLGAAVSVAVDALRQTGGKVVLFASSLPTVGLGALRQRTETTQSMDKVNPLLCPQGEFYTKLAQQAAANGVSISTILTPTAFIDIATLGQLSSFTGGSCSSYSRFSLDSYGEQIKEDVLMTVCKPFVFYCVARVRCGEGLQTVDYFGPCVPQPASAGTPRSDIQFGCLSCDQSFAVSLHHDGRLLDNETTGIQCAILHTTPAGQRRIRVINLALPSTKQAVDVFRSCDYEAIVSLLTKQSLSKLHSSSLAQLTTSMLFSRVSQILAAYRKVAASNVAASQLILPEELRLLPIMTLSVLKSTAFSPITATADARMFGVRVLLDLANDLLFPHLYPRLYNLLSLTDVSPNGRAPLLRLSRDSLDRQENGFKLIIWVGDMVPAPVLANLFGVPQIGSINPHMKLPLLNNSISQSVHSLIESIRLERVRSLILSVVRQGIDQAAEAELLQSLLIEDGSPAGPSYSDFLCRLHGQVQHDVGTMSSSTSLLADKSALLGFFH